MYLIWANFGITEMCSGLIDITGSKLSNMLKLNTNSTQLLASQQEEKINLSVLQINAGNALVIT